MSALLTVEEGGTCQGKTAFLRDFYRLGVRMMTLTWNGKNELGSGPASEEGLTAFGKEAVRELEEAGIIVDCSHLNDAGFADLLHQAKKPFVASHSNLRSCCDHPRNLREDQFKELVRRGGLCGINLYSRFLSVPDRGGEGERELLFRHIYRMLELGLSYSPWDTEGDGGEIFL